MSQFIENLHYKIKTTSGSMVLTSMKILVGSILGLTFALIGQEILSYGQLAFLFVVVSVIMIFMRIARGWRWPNVLAFSLICGLIGILLKMYIQLAPGA